MITKNTDGNDLSAAFLEAVAQPMVRYDLKLAAGGAEVACVVKAAQLSLGAGTVGDLAVADFECGQVLSTQLDAELYDAPSLMGQVLDVLVGVDVGGSFERVRVARVQVATERIWKGISSIRATGSAGVALSAPAGLSDGRMAPAALAAAIASAAGIAVELGAFADTSQDVAVSASMTCREALSALALNLGGFAAETPDGGMLVSPFSGTATYTMPSDFAVRAPDVQPEDYEVDGIEVTDGLDAWTRGTGRVHMLVPGATEGTADMVWANLGGYGYRPGRLHTALLDPRVTCFDVVSATVDGSTYTVPSLGIEAKFDGGYFGTYSAAGLTAVQEEALREGPVSAQSAEARRLAAEAQAVAEATNQHFWHRSTDPDQDGAGTGAFVTDEDREGFLDAIAHDVQPTESRPLHNLIMNSQGILLRAAKRIRAAFTPSGVAFYDGQGNDAANVVARFGSDGAQVGKDGNSVSISSNGMTIANNNAEVMRVYSDDVYSGRNTIVFKGSDITSTAGGTMVSVGMNAAPDESTEHATESRAHVGASASGNSVRATCYSTETGSSFTVEHDYGEGYVTALESFMDEYGSISYDIGDPPAFRDALDLGLLALKDTLDASDIPSLPYLPLAGGTLTGQLDGTAAVFSGNVEGNQLTFGKGAAGTRYYLVAKTPSRSSHVLWAGGGAKADGNANGTVVGLGAGGLTIVGGGKYATNRYGLADLNDGDKQLYLGSDNDVTIESNGNTIVNRHQLVFNKAGNLMIEAKGNQGYKAVYPYNSNEPPASNKATQILCSYNSDRKREGAYVQPTWMANGGVHAQFGAQVAPGGTPKYHYLSLGYDSDSNPTVNMTAKDKWRDALELGALALGTASQEGALDCDALPTGIHYVNSYGSNTPVSGTGGMCVCVKVSNGTQAVQAFVTNNANTPLHVRSYSSNAWTTWRQVG